MKSPALKQVSARHVLQHRRTVQPCSSGFRIPLAYIQRLHAPPYLRPYINPWDRIHASSKHGGRYHCQGFRQSLNRHFRRPSHSHDQPKCPVQGPPRLSCLNVNLDGNLLFSNQRQGRAFPPPPGDCPACHRRLRKLL
ncbi:unnamed protein product [Schistocephalus solidus]|uniref:Uncharacterized protein n=1 Tax=Schistocephalus solidus TaxID=70667 RepID=A0A183ST13_SCHSO|nr:unnamed protein product [Schistocephalus solidus]